MPHTTSLHLPDLLEPPLQDLHKPDANRLRRNLSGIINFAKFREEKLAPYTDMQEAAEHLLEETAQLEEQQLQLVGGWLGPTAGSVGMQVVPWLAAWFTADAALPAAWQVEWQGPPVAVLPSSSGGCGLARHVSCVHLTSILSQGGMLCVPAASRAATTA